MASETIASRKPEHPSLEPASRKASWRALLDPYAAIIQVTVRSLLAYRTEYLGIVVSTVVFVGIQYCIWQAVFGGMPVGGSINGFTFPEILAYISLGWLLNTILICHIDYGLNTLVRTGNIGVELLKPLDFQTFMVAGAVGGLLYRILFVAPVLLLSIWLIFGFNAPATALSMLETVLTAALSFLTLAYLDFLVGLLAFYLHSIHGIITAKQVLLQLFSGLLLPLIFFPEWLRNILAWLPFKNILYVPLMTYLGKLQGEDLVLAFGSQVLWCVILCLAGRLIWRHAHGKLSIEGG